jgi:hypothetical protein
MMTESFSSNTLVSKMAKKNKVLTLEVTFETSAEFQVATDILGAKSYATLLHQYVIQKIREAKQLVSDDEFEKRVEEKKLKIENRSKMKSLERQKSVDKLADDTIPSTSVSEIKKKKESNSKKK